MPLNYSHLKKWAKFNGITISDFCEKIGYSEAGFYKALNKNQIPSNILEEISKVTGISLPVLIGEEELELKILNEKIALLKQDISRLELSVKAKQELNELLKNANR